MLLSLPMHDCCSNQMRAKKQMGFKYPSVENPLGTMRSTTLLFYQQQPAGIFDDGPASAGSSCACGT